VNEDIVEDVNYNEYEIAPGVTMNLLDIEGLNTKQQKQARLKADIAKDEGEIVYEIFTDVNPEIRIAPNVDFDLDKMTPEQREIYEALRAQDDEGYEELEDDFVLVANEGIVPMRKKEEVKEEIVKAVEVEQVKGDQIEMKSFMDIIRKDAALLGITNTNNKIEDIDREDDYDYNEDDNSDDNIDDYDEIRETKDVSDSKPKVTFSEDVDVDQPADILELMAINKPVKKGMEVVEQRVENIAGGGKLIFRKVKKIKKPENQSEIKEEENHEENLDDLDPHEIDENKLDELSFEVESDGEGITKSELDKLEDNYQRLKALKNERKKNKNGDDSDSEYNYSDEEVEIIKVDGEELIKYKKRKNRVIKTEYNVKDDTAIQQLLENESDDNLDDLERPKMRKLNAETCPTAPQERIKPSNYYCMAVVKEDLEVKRNIKSIQKTKCKCSKRRGGRVRRG